MVLLGARAGQHLHAEGGAPILWFASAAAAVVVAATYSRLCRSRCAEDENDRYQGLVLVRDPDEKEPEEEPDPRFRRLAKDSHEARLFWFRAAWDRRQSQPLPEALEAIVWSFLDEPAGWRRMVGTAVDDMERALAQRAAAAAAASAGDSEIVLSWRSEDESNEDQTMTISPTSSLSSSSASSASVSAASFPAAFAATATATTTSTAPSAATSAATAFAATATATETASAATAAASRRAAAPRGGGAEGRATTAASRATATATTPATTRSNGNGPPTRPRHFPVQTAALKDFLSALKEVQTRLTDESWLHGRRPLVERLARRVEELRLLGAFEAFWDDWDVGVQAKASNEPLEETFASVGALLRCALAELWEDRDYIGGARPRRAGGRVPMQGLTPL